MAIIGALWNLGIGAYNYVNLPKKIEELEGELKKPISNYLTDKERYFATTDLALLRLYKALEFRNDTDRSQAISKYLVEVEENLMDNKDTLNATPATKFDVERLAISLNELALLFDKNIDAFESKANDSISEFVKTGKAITKKQLEESEKAISEFRATVQVFVNETKHVINDAIDELTKSLHDSVEIQKAEVRTEINSSVELRKKIDEEIGSIPVKIDLALEKIYSPQVKQLKLYVGAIAIINVIMLIAQFAH